MSFEPFPTPWRLPERPTRKCEHCGEPFDYVENPQFDVTLKDPSPHVATLAEINFWKPVPHKACEERARAEAREAMRQREEKHEEDRHAGLVYASGIDHVELEATTFASFRPTEGAADALAALQAWTPDIGAGLLLEGPVGVGKTHLLKAFAHKWIKRGTLVVFKNTGALLDELRSGYADHSNARRLASVIKAPILVLDDFGAEHMTEWAEASLFAVLDGRLSARLPTFFSTNLTLAQLQAKRGERIASRIQAAAIPITVTGDDYRETLCAQNMAKLKRRLLGTDNVVRLDRGPRE